MDVIAKEQTAFRFDTELIQLMKSRAKSLGKSMNAYVTELIEKDIESIHQLPKIEVPSVLEDVVAEYAGCMKTPSKQQLAEDERLERIWNR